MENPVVTLGNLQAVVYYILDGVGDKRQSVGIDDIRHKPELICGGLLAFPFHFDGEESTLFGQTEDVARTRLAPLKKVSRNPSVAFAGIVKLSRARIIPPVDIPFKAQIFRNLTRNVFLWNVDEWAIWHPMAF